MAAPPAYDLVIPTVGRASLGALLDALAGGSGPPPQRILLVDDRAAPAASLAIPGPMAHRVEIHHGTARGPAAARNLGWRAARAPWVVFLDDDVIPTPSWAADLATDLGRCVASSGGSQGRIVVPLPRHRRPTDWERNVHGLERARWATADLAYRRAVLAEVGGFDERFPRAYREDADLGLRVTAAGHRIESGSRSVVHPVRPAPWHVSVAKQAGNADDALMERLHGPRWRERAAAAPGGRRRHVATTAAALVALGGALAGQRTIALTGALAWLASTVDLAARRIAPGPRTPAEIGAMAATSAALPVAATHAYLRGLVGARRMTPRGSSTPRRGGDAPVEAVLFDRDGTLVVDVAYNGDPDLVEPVPTARAALDRLRAAGLPVAIVSNQSGVARGLLDLDQVDAVNRRIEDLLGPFAAVLVCPHGPGDRCRDRKPGPGMVERAAAALGVPVERCVVVGDIGSDVDAARAAGARPILVPTAATSPDEVAAAPVVAEDLARAVELILTGSDR